MRILTIPEATTQRYEWMTRVITGRDGTEQRIALRTIPRQTLKVDHLADSEELIQSWKTQFITQLGDTWGLPLWAEAESITATAAGNTATGDFSLMDDTLVPVGVTDAILVIHPDGVTYETATVATKVDATITISGTWTNTYPEGSALVPIMNVFVKNNSGYSPGIVNVASVPIDVTAETNAVITARGASALATYNGKSVLDRVYSPGGSELFSQRLERLDFGHKIQVDTSQLYGNIVSGRSYVSRGREDRQWWKLFMQTVKGQQKSFYTSTQRQDMTVTTQPTTAGTTFRVDDSANVAAGVDAWENITSHLQLALEMEDGSTLYKEISPGATVDNGDGTHTVGVTVAFPASPAAAYTITKVSFLELVRLASDVVEMAHHHDHRVVNIQTRTIIV